MHPIAGEVVKNAPQVMGPHMMGEVMRPMMYAGGGYVAAHAVSSGAVGRLLRNPLVLLAAGAALGYLVYRYRKEIIAAAAKASDAGKDFLLQQKESLADLVAEAREAEERAAKGGGEGVPPETKPGE
jgi:hypothetical protein